MAEGRQRDTWNHTASVLAMLYNSFARGRKTPADFHPFLRANAPRIGLSELAKMGFPQQQGVDRG